MHSIHLRENRQHGGLLLPLSCYEAQERDSLHTLECHWHEEMELFKVMKGSLRIQVEESVFEATAGELLFFNSEELHAAVPLEGETCCFRAVVFSPDLLCGPEGDRIRLDYILPILKGNLVMPRKISQIEPGGAEIHQCFDTIYELTQNRPERFPFLVKAEMFRLFAYLLEKAKPGDEASGSRRSEAVSGVKEAISYIQQQYSKPIMLRQLADLCGMSEGHFCRVFKQYALKTPVQYITAVRLSKAMELLRETDRKILDIALDTGFNSLSYFIGVFRENTGVTPSAYRQGEEPRR